MLTENKQASVQPLCSSLVLSRNERSEGRRNRCEAATHLLRATRTSSRMPKDISGVLVLIMANSKHPKHAQSHVKINAKSMPKVCSVENNSRFKQKQFATQLHKEKQPKRIEGSKEGISFFTLADAVRPKAK